MRLLGSLQQRVALAKACRTPLVLEWERVGQLSDSSNALLALHTWCLELWRDNALLGVAATAQKWPESGLVSRTVHRGIGGACVGHSYPAQLAIDLALDGARIRTGSLGVSMEATAQVAIVESFNTAPMGLLLAKLGCVRQA